MAITASQVNALRQKTGISMMACKKALDEAGGDEEKAIEILRKKGEAKAVDKAERETKEGAISFAKSGNKAVMAKIACETDFVAKNDDFIKLCDTVAQCALDKGAHEAKAETDGMIAECVGKLGENMLVEEIKEVEGDVIGSYVHSNKKIGTMVVLEGGDEAKANDVAMHVTAMNPAVISPEEISEELVAKEKEIWKEQLLAEGKPENILDNIMMGKEKKFREESALIKQPFVKNPEQTIEQYLEGAKVKEFVVVRV